ncbi:MAG: hypothetical protein ACLRXQ_03525 [Phascolarctobacterium faecium]
MCWHPCIGINGRDLYEERCYEGLAKVEAVREFLIDTLANLERHNNFDALPILIICAGICLTQIKN